MKLRSRILAILVAVSAFSAYAQEGPPPGGMMPQGERLMFRAGGIGTLGFVSIDKPAWGLAWLPIDHMMVGAALSLTYDGNGLGNPAAPLGPRSSDKWRTALILAAEYMVVDKFPFAMGPQMSAMGNLTPGTALSYVELVPAWGFWYAPWNAPVAIGSALAVSIVLQKGLNPVVSLQTPMLRLVYVFN